MIPVTIRYLEGANYPPEPGKYKGDIGIDIRAHFPGCVTQDREDDHPAGRMIPGRTILPGHGVWIEGGFHLQFEPGWAGLVLPRSSTSRSGIHVFTGVIDNGYAGVIGAQVQNLTYDPITIHEGQRIAQLVLIPAFRPVPISIAQLQSTDRGDKGWGSSGS